jgi:dipeptidyl aminopeptidase/acylaminoacyl peptidase
MKSTAGEAPAPASATGDLATDRSARRARSGRSAGRAVVLGFGSLVGCVAACGLVTAGAQAAVGNGQIAAVVHTYATTTLAPDRLVTVNPDGTGLRTLATFPHESLAAPAWSPDGNRIALSLSEPLPTRIYIYDVATGQLSQLTYPQPQPYFRADKSPSWSPDGTRLAFDRTGLPQQLMTVGADGTDERQVFALGTLNFPGPLHWTGSEWSPIGDRIAFIGHTYPEGEDPIEGLHAIAPDSTGFLTIFEEGNRGKRDPSWSPDGTRLVFSDDSGGSNLRVVDAVAGAVPTDLTPNAVARGDTGPDWSPDGTWVVFQRNWQLLRVSPDGLRTEVVLDGVPWQEGSLSEPDWQPCVTGVTISCTSPTPGATSTPNTGTGSSGADRAAPTVRWLTRLRLDRRGRARVRLRCNERCLLSLHLSARLRSGKSRTGPTKTVTAAAGRRVTFTLAISRHGHHVSLTRLRRVATVGFVKDETGNRRSLRRAVSLASLPARR